ncbi:rac GTPase-activating protein 1-like [Venturia canescens]|uniref:rac GTPase-activating protein 1-like n=1 Tax=Venturia canescens TaxID=32260 RepID=UPI001C9D0BBD|nr:rac GTPase-activating protein 1-like [Venturia canescens]
MRKYFWNRRPIVREHDDQDSSASSNLSADSTKGIVHDIIKRNTEKQTNRFDPAHYSKPLPNIRKHEFVRQRLSAPENCSGCYKEINSGEVALYCSDCNQKIHIDCKNALPLPCVPTSNIRNLSGQQKKFEDYAPIVPPMIPALIIHCIREIELRGMQEKYLHQRTGISGRFTLLAKEFLKDRKISDLRGDDIPTISSTLKEFLRSFREPLITFELREFFIYAAMLDENTEVSALVGPVVKLPQPNRDTLALLIQHLQRVSNTPECRMTVRDLAKVFGPVLVGYGSEGFNSASMFNETPKQIAVFEGLMKIPSNYWAEFVDLKSLMGQSQSPGVTLRRSESGNFNPRRSSNCNSGYSSAFTLSTDLDDIF